jgi:hypothetical protein
MLDNFGLLGKNKPGDNPAKAVYDNRKFFSGLILLNKKKNVLQE